MSCYSCGRPPYYQWGGSSCGCDSEKGCNCSVQAGDGIQISGAGSGDNPYVVSTDLDISITDNCDGTFTFCDHEGNCTTIDMCGKCSDTLTTLVDNGDGTLTYTAEDGCEHVIDICAMCDDVLTTITDNGDGTFTYVDEEGNPTIVDMCLNCSDVETNITDNGDGTFTYINETGSPVTVDMCANCDETLTTITDNTDGTFTYIDEAGNPTTVDMCAACGETLTSLVDNGDGTITYTDEDGTPNTINVCDDCGETLTTLVDNGNGTITYTDEDGNQTTINVEEVTTLTDNGDGTVTYINENNLAVTITVNTVTTLVDNTDGTFTYTSEDGTVTTIDLCCEVATLVDNGNGTFTYTDEAGVATTVDLCCDEATFVQNADGSYTYTHADGTTVVNIPAPSTGATSTITDNADGTFTHTDGAGTSTTIALCDLIDALTVSGDIPNAGTAVGETVLGIDENGDCVLFDPPGCPCPAEELTIAESQARMGACDLVIGQHYLITDYAVGTVGASTILTHGVSDCALSHDVHVLTPHDTTAWDGRYDPDNGEIYALFDNEGNEVSGDKAGTEVSTFPWGNPLVTNNKLRNTVLIYNGGELRDNDFQDAGQVTVNGGFVIGNEFIGANDLVLDAQIEDNTFNRTNGLINTSSFVRSNTFQDNPILGAIAITGTARFWENDVSSSEVFVDTGEVIKTHIIRDSLLDLLGSTNASIRSSTIDNAQVQVLASTAVDFDDVEVLGNGAIAVTGVTKLKLNHVGIRHSARIFMAAATSLDMEWSTVESAGEIDMLQGSLVVEDSHWNSKARTKHDTAGASEITLSHFNSAGRVDFLNTADDNHWAVGEVTAGGEVYFEGNTAGFSGTLKVVSNTVDGNGRWRIKNQQPRSVQSNTVSSFSDVILENGIAGGGFPLLYRLEAASGGVMDIDGGNFSVDSVTVASSATVQVVNSDNRIRFSHFTSNCQYNVNAIAAGNDKLDLFLADGTRNATAAPVTGTSIANF